MEVKRNPEKWDSEAVGLSWATVGSYSCIKRIERGVAKSLPYLVHQESNYLPVI